MRALAGSPAEGLLAELADGAAALRAYARRQGRELDLVESSAACCTVRAACDAVDSWPVEVSVSGADVERAGLAHDPDWLADPHKFLAAWATREAARIVLPAVLEEFEEERLLARLCEAVSVERDGCRVGPADARAESCAEGVAMAEARRTWVRRRRFGYARHQIVLGGQARRRGRRRPVTNGSDGAKERTYRRAPHVTSVMTE